MEENGCWRNYDFRRNKVLMLAYSNANSLRKTYDIKKATYYSRSRKELWTKGEKSGNIQYIQKIYLDCDSDLNKFVQEHSNFDSYTEGYFLHLATDHLFYNRFLKTWNKSIYEDYNLLNAN